MASQLLTDLSEPVTDARRLVPLLPCRDNPACPASPTILGLDKIINVNGLIGCRLCASHLPFVFHSHPNCILLFLTFCFPTRKKKNGSSVGPSCSCDPTSGIGGVEQGSLDRESLVVAGARKKQQQQQQQQWLCVGQRRSEPSPGTRTSYHRRWSPCLRFPSLLASDQVDDSWVGQLNPTLILLTIHPTPRTAPALPGTPPLPPNSSHQQTARIPVAVDGDVSPFSAIVSPDATRPPHPSIYHYL